MENHLATLFPSHDYCIER